MSSIGSPRPRTLKLGEVVAEKELGSDFIPTLARTLAQEEGLGSATHPGELIWSLDTGRAGLETGGLTTGRRGEPLGSVEERVLGRDPFETGSYDSEHRSGHPKYEATTDTAQISDIAQERVDRVRAKAKDQIRAHRQMMTDRDYELNQDVIRSNKMNAPGRVPHYEDLSAINAAFSELSDTETDIGKLISEFDPEGQKQAYRLKSLYERLKNLPEFSSSPETTGHINRLADTLASETAEHPAAIHATKRLGRIGRMIDAGRGNINMLSRALGRRGVSAEAIGRVAALARNKALGFIGPVLELGQQYDAMEYANQPGNEKAPFSTRFPAYVEQLMGAPAGITGRGKLPSELGQQL